MFTDFGFQVCDKIYHLISQHFNPTFIEITCAELHEKLEVAATEEQIKNWLTVVNLFKPQTLLLEQVNYLNQQIDRSVTALSEKVKRHKETLRTSPPRPMTADSCMMSNPCSDSAVSIISRRQPNWSMMLA